MFSKACCNCKGNVKIIIIFLNLFLKRRTGKILEAMSAAPFPFPIGDIKINGHWASNGEVAVGGDPHTQQTLK